MPDRLDRFRQAQDASDTGFAAALAEMEAGRKTGHWIWYVFPQLSGLGQSEFSQRFGIDGEKEAMAYLRDPILRARLLAVTSAVAKHLTARPAPQLRQLMASEIDARKLVSSLTLFGHVAEKLHGIDGHDDYRALAAAARTVLAAAEAQGYPPCDFTLALL